MVTATELFCGVALDLAIGDPRWLPHPVAGIGHLAAAAERVCRALSLPLLLAGALAWLSVMSITAAVVYLSLLLLPRPWIQIYWIFSMLALRSLDIHAQRVIDALRLGDLGAARKAVAMIVGRDTQDLSAPETTRAVFETVAESLNDGVIAPLFWLAAGGPLGMCLYKAINTMDSMFGYRNERYLAFGRVAARMDDLANLIPARLAALLIWMVALVLPGVDAKASYRITLRDAHKQPSPNSGYPEAAVAGALGIQFGGVNYYQGVRSEKAFIGDPHRPLDWSQYGSLRAITYSATLLFVLFLGGIAQWL